MPASSVLAAENNNDVDRFSHVRETRGERNTIHHSA